MKTGFIGFAAALVLGFGTMVNATPIEYDLYITTQDGRLIEIGFLIDPDRDGVLKYEDGSIYMTKTDTPIADWFYATLTRIGDEAITEENWYKTSDGDDAYYDQFTVQQRDGDDYFGITMCQDWNPGTTEDDRKYSGYAIHFTGLTSADMQKANPLENAELRSFFEYGGDRFVDVKTWSFTAPATSPIPEPATLLLFGAGLLSLAGYSRKMKGESLYYH